MYRVADSYELLNNQIQNELYNLGEFCKGKFHDNFTNGPIWMLLHQWPYAWFTKWTAEGKLDSEMSTQQYFV